MEIIKTTAWNCSIDIPLYFTGIVEFYSVGEINKFLWKEYRKNGIEHRVDGPAVIYYDGSKEWWFEGKKISPMELFDKLTDEEKEKVAWELNEWK